MHKVKTDSRNWGRYVMRELLGKSGASMVIVSIYLPTKSSSKQPGGGAWDWQVQQMGKLKARLEQQMEKGCIGTWEGGKGRGYRFEVSWDLPL